MDRAMESQFTEPKLKDAYDGFEDKSVTTAAVHDSTVVCLDNDPTKQSSLSLSDPSINMGVSVPTLDKDIALTWNSLGFQINKKEKKSKVETLILKDTYGCLRPGNMMAVMGTSGAGKTTFLNILSGRNLGKGKVVGEVLLNGQKRDHNFKRITAYVEQDDNLMPHLTVKETFTFHALLRLPASLSTQAKLKRAMDVVNELGLGHALNTKIGSTIVKGVSGGERKRCAIGVEMITNPQILFLDEPTSGLDSFTAFHVMETMREVANQGRAVMCTIHQPRNNIFCLFDKLMLLSKGVTVYYGPADQATDLFAQAGYPCEKHNNPADHLLDVTTIDNRTAELNETTLERNQKLIQTYRASQYYQNSVAESRPERYKSEGHPPAKTQTRWPLSFLQQFFVLWRRAFLNFTRDKRAAIATAMQTLFVAIVTGVVFLDLGVDQNSVQNRAGSLFFITTNQTFGPMFVSMLAFHNERSIFLRERAAGAYQVGPYFLAKSLAEVSLHVLFPVLFGSIVYWMMGLQADVGCFFFFLLVLVCHDLTAQGLGLVLSAATPTMDVAQALGPVIVVTLMLFGGFFLNSEDIWVGFRWIEQASFITFTYRALMVNEFTGLSFTCDATRCQSTGDEVLHNLNMAQYSKWQSLGCLVAVAVAMRLVAYVFLRVLSKPKIVLA